MQFRLFHQRGISLIQVAIVMATLAAIAMAGLMSMRHEHNYFTDIANKVLGKPAASAPAAGGEASAAAAPAPTPGNVLRKCVVNGKTVLSDVDCNAANPTSRVVKSLDTRGIEAPKVPKPDPADSAPQSATDKMIEKATR